MAVEEGKTVTLDYTGTLDDGTEFDSSKKHGQQLTFKVGSGQVIKGFDDNVRTMSVDETKKFRLEPSEAYGEKNDQLVLEVEKSKLPQEQEPQVGMVLGISSPDGKQSPATIIEVTDDKVKIDANHPLAGKALTFEITLSKVE